MRMAFGTYHIARMMKGMVLSTDNLSEYWMAFWTLHGDVGDFGMIQMMLKGLELYDLARYLGVPSEIIAARPELRAWIAYIDMTCQSSMFQIASVVTLRRSDTGTKKRSRRSTM
jgi:NH3-dependent NAD+ synthetase